jgi:hypothetical protein
VCGVWSVGGSGGNGSGCYGDGAFGVQSRTTPPRRSMCATSTAAERGQVPEREALGPSKKTLLWVVKPFLKARGENSGQNNHQPLEVRARSYEATRFERR